MNDRTGRAAFILGAGIASTVVLVTMRGIELDRQMDAGDLRPPLGTGTTIFAILAVIALNALVSASDSAVRSLKPVHARTPREGDTKSVSRLQWMLDQKTKLAASLSMAGKTGRILLVLLGFLLGLDLANTAHVQWGLALGWGTVILATVIAAIPVGALNLIVGELLPHSFASVRPQVVALRLNAFIRVMSLVFTMPATMVLWFTTRITTRFAPPSEGASSNQAEEEIKTIVESAQVTGEIESEEKELLHSVFEFTDTIAREVMTPRVDMDALPVESEPSDIVRLMRATGHSRIPLYEETDDQIVGIIHAKELLMAMVENEDVQIRNLMRPAIFVPENKDIHELLSEMRQNRSHLAVVQDEFGGTAGIVTIEDIVEELVGEIVDEYDQEEPEVVDVGSGFLIDGKTHIDDVNDEIGSDFQSEEFDTIGGFVFGLFGRQPKLGEHIDDSGYRFTVADTDGRRILRLRVEKQIDELIYREA